MDYLNNIFPLSTFYLDKFSCLTNFALRKGNAFSNPLTKIMTTEQFPSKLLERAVSELAKLPGVGRRTALRWAMYLLKQDARRTDALAESLIQLRHDVKFCKVCHNISDTDICEICSNSQRDHSTICVVENIRGVLAIEATAQYRGLYHVLGGAISPVDGVGPADLEIESLVERVKAGGVHEVILALNPTMEGDTTNFYITRKLGEYDVQITTLARGLSVGDDLEYTDELTLGRSILGRVPIEK
jgi:recombination protein RecR